MVLESPLNLLLISLRSIVVYLHLYSLISRPIREVLVRGVLYSLLPMYMGIVRP